MTQVLEGAMQIWYALTTIMVVSPLWAGLWLGAAIVLAVILVYVWPRLLDAWTDGAGPK